MAYITYDDYIDMGGSVTDEAAFARYAARASALITRLTHGRVADEDPARDAVQYAAYDLIEAYQREDSLQADGREIASMTNDGVSVVYNSGDTSRQARLASIVCDYLSGETTDEGVLLLYAGVDA